MRVQRGKQKTMNSINSATREGKQKIKRSWRPLARWGGRWWWLAVAPVWSSNRETNRINSAEFGRWNGKIHVLTMKRRNPQYQWLMPMPIVSSIPFGKSWPKWLILIKEKCVSDSVMNDSSFVIRATKSIHDSHHCNHCVVDKKVWTTLAIVNQIHESFVWSNNIYVQG